MTTQTTTKKVNVAGKAVVKAIPKKEKDKNGKDNKPAKTAAAGGSMAQIMAAAAKNDAKNLKKYGGQIGTGDLLETIDLSPDPNKYILMPNWWKELTMLPGIPHGQVVTFAGPSNSGKTTGCIETIAAALKQGNTDVLYAETEGKTFQERLESAGIDVSQIGLVSHKVVEVVWKFVHSTIDVWAKHNAGNDRKLLVIIDSLGQTLSQRDADMDAIEDKEKVGGSAKTNTTQLKNVVYKSIVNQNRITTLIIAATMAPMKAMAFNDVIKGGEVIFNSSILIMSCKPGKVEKKEKGGAKFQTGMQAIWKVRKNHALIGLKDKDGKPVALRDSMVFILDDKGMRQVGKIRESDDVEVDTDSEDSGDL